MNKKIKTSILKKCLKTGASFSEIFLENTWTKTLFLSNSKIEEIKEDNISGMGLRIALDGKKVYGFTNIINSNSINSLIKKLTINFNNKTKNIIINLENLKKYKKDIKISHNKYPDIKKILLLHKIDELARKENPLINQVEIKLVEKDQTVEISNSLNKNVQEKRTFTRLYINVYVKKEERLETGYKAIGYNLGYEMFNHINIEKEIKELVETTIEKLTSLPCPGGTMPVIIGPGFGGVIFHEACGHALEATSVAKGISVFSNKKGEKIAKKCITLVDDGTYDNLYGTTILDDEGNPTRKNILIEKGILKNYLVDYLNEKDMNQKSTSSGRRESYKYSPTSRMNNTYIEKGTDNIDDMIKSIKYGLYAKAMGGGSVNPATGQFNFGVRDAYIIRNGKICEPVLGASLIGNSKDIMKNVSMVSNDLSLESGHCGSISGYINNTVGQPTIKVDKILVGGSEIIDNGL